MIDRETAISWAKDAGLYSDGENVWICSTEEIQNLINRVYEEGRKQGKAEAAAEVLRISDRKHEACDRLLRAALAKHGGV